MTIDAIRADAERWLQQGRWDQSISAYRQWLAHSPADADAWYNLGFLQHRTGQFEAALCSYARALQLDVPGPEEVHLNCAVILAEHLARPADAEAALRTALTLAPSYLPAWVNLGNLAEQRGDRLEALAAYERALELDPWHALALSRLPHLIRVKDTDDPLLARLQHALARSSMSYAERADIGFALGKALDDAKDYDAAFAAYTSANQASRAAGGDVRYDRGAHEHYVNQLIAAFPAAPQLAAPPDPGSAARPGAGPAPRLIFICGLFRSGSTLVERILSRHSAVTAGGELSILPALVEKHRRTSQSGFAALDRTMEQTWRRHYLDAVALRHPDARWLTDKRPDNFLAIGVIRRLFPDAVIIHTHRNPLDNSLSQYFLHLSRALPYALDLEDIGHWHGQYRRLMSHWQLVGMGVHDLDYDQLVHEPRRVIERLLAACGLPWEERCLQFHQEDTAAGPVSTPSAWQVREPLYTRSSGRWRHYAKHLAALRRGLGTEEDAGQTTSPLPD